MSTAASTLAAPDYTRPALPAAVFEVLAYLIVVAVGCLAFLAGWLTVNAAVVLAVVLLVCIVILSWIHLGQGRHPAFLFLSSLLFFQGSRLIGFCLGVESDPMQIIIMTLTPFSIHREVQALVLLAIVLSAIGIYAPCRWLYRPLAPPDLTPVQKYLPYLYVVFAATLPLQVFRNYRYYQYAMEHGGYAFFYTDRAALASSVPFVVRAISLITLPVFVAIFVFEWRRSRLMLATILYFVTASLILLLGSRAGPLLLVGTLWWISRVKSQRKLRIVRFAVLVLALLVVADVVQEHRKGENESGAYRFDPLKLVVSQGVSLNVREVAFQYRELFSPYAPSYLLTELRSAFLPSDVTNYRRGKSLAIDVSVFLQPERYGEGYGTGGSYVGEAYVIGGMLGLLFVSVALGLLLQVFYRFSGNAKLLFLFAIAFPDVLLLPKGQLLDWASVFLKNCILIALIEVGWKAYKLLASIRHTSGVEGTPNAIKA